ncbi:hypothetical protein ACFLU6_09725 [Acidobacteriota bacterium]
MEDLINQLTWQVFSIQDIVAKLHESRYPSPTPLKLSLIIKNITEAIYQNILTRYRTLKNPSRDLEIQIKLAIQAIQRLGADLRYVERAAAPQTSWGLVRTLEKIGRKLHPDSYFIIRPQWHYNYSLFERLSGYQIRFKSLIPKKQLADILKFESKRSIKKLYIMGFPYLDQSNILKSTLFGHELGHPIEKEYFLTEDTTKLYPELYKEILRAYDEKTKQTKEKDKLIQIHQIRQMAQRVLRFRRKALAELISDLVCVNLFGPAALFAAEEWARGLNLDSFEKIESKHYPPRRYRLRLMHQTFLPDWIERYIDKGKMEEKYADAVKSKYQVITDIVGDETDKRLIFEETEIGIAYKVIERNMADIIEFVKSRLAKRGFKLDNLVGKTNQTLINRLENWIPPDSFLSKEGKDIPAEIRSILNVAWIVYLANYSSITKQADQKKIYLHHKQVEALNRLTLKAIEYVDIRSIWKQREKG